MAWKKLSEEIDKRTGIHYVKLHEPESGARHDLVIHIGLDACPHCGVVKQREGVDEYDPKQIVQDHLEALQASHDAMDEYAKRHKVPVKKAVR